MTPYLVRTIVPSDNDALAAVIRTALEEQGNNKEGTIYTDPLLVNMFSGYQATRSVYYVVIQNGELLGGCGVAPIPNQPGNYCELQRMFLKKEARGKGIGKDLMERCLQFARESGYELIYIETFDNMQEAIRLYEKSGFKRIDGPLGNTGHFSCDVYLTQVL